ncbi:MAG: DUF92 domain-containing protein [Balneolaceae bacterium]
MPGRFVNIFLLFALVFISILFGDAEEHSRTMIAVVLATIFSLLAFIFKWLTIDGTAAAIIFGAIAYGIGGATGAGVVLAFFITGSILSKDFAAKEGFLKKKFRRDGNQVWANGFWFALWIMIWFLTNSDLFLIAAVSSIAVATADTWASEIGGKTVKGKTKLISTGEIVLPGTHGGISFYGTLAAFCGAILIALVFGAIHPVASFAYILIIIATGIVGCFIDSYIGARFQNNVYSFSGYSIFGYQNLYVTNDFVNFVSAGLASLIGLFLTLII